MPSVSLLPSSCIVLGLYATTDCASCVVLCGIVMYLVVANVGGSAPLKFLAGTILISGLLKPLRRTLRSSSC